ncbi:PRC-barrel domain-containing protein [Lichenifustis flavocetrariae]|uniref:PRC-barrel domain-containing protein n=1 Tax=Lichenifustis flavocetrariae TaxID=2949735 RepID=A0AA41Z7H2_9HYPH|nr:PRC-barrel domain-containing protein [Lichenifustis flavocetrariae]MCW6511903.1 PRC-barrel domain-containing protein [Lichenifustis flavocetrariae]
MLIAVSALKGYAVEASDGGGIGKVHDLLFDDVTWRLRWLVVDVGSWLSDRKVLVHPSSIRNPDYVGQVLPLTLTKLQIENSPPLATDQPVSTRMETNLFDYCGSDPLWGYSYFGGDGLGGPLGGPRYLGGRDGVGLADDDEGDPHLRSLAEVTGYHMHAVDGEIGHAENFLVDDANWDVRYIIVDTRNWWPGEHVLISPYAVKAVSWRAREIRLDVGRERVKSSPPWDPIAMIDQVYEKKLHTHYGWRGYGF